jgi:hypothetical protein
MGAPMVSQRGIGSFSKDWAKTMSTNVMWKTIDSKGRKKDMDE